jgi:hypothetical protein
VPASGSVAAGQADVFEPQQVFVLRSQHCTPPARAGQLFVQSESVAHVGAHFLSAGGVLAGVLAGVDAGTLVSAGGGAAGSVGLVSSAGGSALFAQAASAATRAVTANADFDKVTYFTGRTLIHEFRNTRPV